MGDVMSLIEKTQDEFDEDQAADLDQESSSSPSRTSWLR